MIARGAGGTYAAMSGFGRLEGGGGKEDVVGRSGEIGHGVRGLPSEEVFEYLDANDEVVGLGEGLDNGADPAMGKPTAEPASRTVVGWAYIVTEAVLRVVGEVDVKSVGAAMAVGIDRNVADDAFSDRAKEVQPLRGPVVRLAACGAEVVVVVEVAVRGHVSGQRSGSSR